MGANQGSRLSTLADILRPAHLTALFKPSHLQAVCRDVLKTGQGCLSDDVHLGGAMDWLCRAQDITGCSGVSKGYHFYEGWMSPYPETTGYISRTFLRYGESTGESRYTDRAIAMGDWEIKIQLPDGAVMGEMGVSEEPFAFDTGQVILGWSSLYRMTERNRFLDAAERAADWLVSVQDEDGKWNKYTHGQMPHTYYVRVAWPLLEVHSWTGKEKYRRAAERNVSWTLSRHRGNGWFSEMGLTRNAVPLTHTIAYTLRGLLECSFYLEDEKKEPIFAIVRSACETIIDKYGLSKKASGYLPATLNHHWESGAYYSCLTGNAQLAVVFLKLYEMNRDLVFLSAALHLIDQLKAAQALDSEHPGIRGALSGSYPIWGAYGRFAYLSWATKFFADALMLKKQRDATSRDEEE